MIAERIKERRRILNLTGAQLAEIAAVSQPYISTIERGVKEPSRRALLALAKALKTSVAYLLGETDNPEALALPGNVFITADDVMNRAIWIPVLDIDELRRFGNIRKNPVWTPLYRYPLIDEAIISLSNNADLYIIPALNNSMRPEITEGDLVLFDKRASHDAGKVAVLCLNGNLLIRGVIKSKESIILRARNWQEFKDIEVTDKDQIHVFGVVLYTIPLIKKIGPIV